MRGRNKLHNGGLNSPSAYLVNIIIIINQEQSLQKNFIEIQNSPDHMKFPSFFKIKQQNIKAKSLQHIK